MNRLNHRREGSGRVSSRPRRCHIRAFQFHCCLSGGVDVLFSFRLDRFLLNSFLSSCLRQQTEPFVLQSSQPLPWVHTSAADFCVLTRTYCLPAPLASPALCRRDSPGIPTYPITVRSPATLSLPVPTTPPPSPFPAAQANSLGEC